ncbi:MAG: hypothetical protein ACE5D8_03815 [Fidelibacterota bacterium]
MKDKTVFILQVASISLIWIFVFSVNTWIASLLFVAHRLNDAINASVAIGLLAIPLFFTIATILTYVFVGLQRNKPAEKS